MQPELASSPSQPPLAAPDSQIRRLQECLEAISPGLAGRPVTGEGASALHAWVRQFTQKLADCPSGVPMQDLQTALTVMSDAIVQLAGAVRSSALVDTPLAPDPTTGLPGRSQAEAAIAAGVASGKPYALSLFVVDRLAFLNAKFGRTAGDEVLVAAARHILQSLPEGAPLFRWNGPAFAAVLEIPHGLTAVERSVKRAATSRLEVTIEAGGRSVMLTVGRAYHLCRLAATDSPPAVFRTLDEFIAVRA